MLIEGWKFSDAFYMTIITISTVGFGEVHPLSEYGQVFTAFLIISSFGIFAYAITSITTYLVGGEYRKYFKEYKIMTEISNKKDHIIVCGFGRVGKQVSDDLSSHGESVVIVEMDEEITDPSLSDPRFVFLRGDSTKDETLALAGVNHAKAIITCLPKDADNLYVVLAAREANNKILIVSRASFSSAVSKLRMAGANNVIMPDSIGGSHMASLIAKPDVMEFLDIIRVQSKKGANVETIAFSELPDNLQNKTIGELEAKRITGVTIIGYRAPDGEYLINPPLDTKVIPHSRLFVLGNTDQIKKLTEYFGLTH